MRYGRLFEYNSETNSYHSMIDTALIKFDGRHSPEKIANIALNHLSNSDHKNAIGIAIYSGKDLDNMTHWFNVSVHKQLSLLRLPLPLF